MLGDDFLITFRIQKKEKEKKNEMMTAADPFGW